MQPRENYIKNKEMHEEWVKCKEEDKCSDLLAFAFMQIVKRYGGKYNFAGYSYIDEMKGEALVTLCANWRKYNPEKTTNAFAYCTQIVHNSFIAYLNKEKKHRRIRDEVLTYQGYAASWSYTETYRRDLQQRIQEETEPDKQVQEGTEETLNGFE